MNIRKDILLRKGWKFTLDPELPTAYYKGLDDSYWETIEVPHDWSVHYPFNKSYASGSGYLKGGTGWYRCHFNLDACAVGKTVKVNFGGVYQNARVWINSNYLGKRPYGYSSFSYDISEFICEGENVIAVTCEHENLADSRWFTGNGVYRDVTLTITNTDYVADVFISTDKVVDGTAYMNIETTTVGSGTVSYEVCYAGETVKSDYVDGQIVIPEAKLWSCESPNLYTLKTILTVDGEVSDVKETTFGARTFSFDANTGFELNGVSMKLKGVCVHHDAGVLGSAVPKEVWRERFTTFLECGCNSIRYAHNPPDTHLLDLCDEMGLLVMDEAFDEWEGCKNKWWQGHNVYPPKHYGYSEYFPDWHEKDLTDLIIRDRNHPSIILWSIGNEIDYPNDPYVHPYFNEMLGNNDKNKPAAERVYDANKPNAERLAKIATNLVSIVKKVDTTRPVTSALAFPELSNRTGYAQALDVVGYNYKEQFYHEDHAKYPNHVLYGSENGGMPERWLDVKNNDFISGQYLWTGIDFLGECHGWPHRASQAGLLTMAGDKKAKFYQRKMLWVDEPSAKIATTITPEDYRGEDLHWNYTDGEKVFVSILTNCDTAQLIVNGKVLEEKVLTEADLWRATWEVPFEAGTLEAICTKGDVVVTDTVVTGGTATTINIDNITKEGDEICQLDLHITDENGNKITHAGGDIDIEYAVTGAKFLGVESGNNSDITAYTNTHRKTFLGNSIVYVKKTAETATLTATSGDISVIVNL